MAAGFGTIQQHFPSKDRAVTVTLPIDIVSHVRRDVSDGAALVALRAGGNSERRRSSLG
jgi:hypothetical protein